MVKHNFRVVLKSRPGVDSEPQVDNFLHQECPYPTEELQDGCLLIRTCTLSVDPALRCLMNEDSGVDYMSSWELGQTIQGSSGVGIVVASKHPGYKEGDLVFNMGLGWPWILYFIHDTNSEGMSQIRKLDEIGGNPSVAMNMLVGLTALIGLWEKGHVKQGANQTLVVSGASGATGSLAGQMGRILGCSNVVGICGTQQKCDWLKNDLGFSGAINYKSDDINASLTSLCPDGVDVYFDNVGGDISDNVIEQMNVNSHVILCGQISQYNKDVPYPPPIPQSTQRILTERNITRDRFLVVRYEQRFEEAIKQFIEWMMSGTIKYHETVAKGLDHAGHAFVSMMKGGNKGKQIVHVSDTVL